MNENNRLSRQERILKMAVNELLLKEQGEIERLKQKAVKGIRHYLSVNAGQIAGHENQLRLLNPENVLKRGYTMTCKQGKIVKSAVVLKEDDDIETRFADGCVKSKIYKTE